MLFRSELNQFCYKFAGTAGTTFNISDYSIFRKVIIPPMVLDVLIIRRYNISGPAGPGPGTRAARQLPKQCPGRPPKQSLEQPPYRARAAAMASLPEGRRTPSAAKPHTRPHDHAPEDTPRSCSHTVLSYILSGLPEYASLKKIIDEYPETMGDNMQDRKSNV